MIILFFIICLIKSFILRLIAIESIFVRVFEQKITVLRYIKKELVAVSAKVVILELN